MMLTKRCSHCGTNLPSNAAACSACGSNELQNICANCGTVFKTGFCPSCGVRAGAQPHICPECGASYFTHACPECGYATTRSASNQSYTMPKTVSAPEKKKSQVGTYILTFMFPFIMLPYFIYKGGYSSTLVTIATVWLALEFVTAIPAARNSPELLILLILSAALSAFLYYKKQKGNVGKSDSKNED